MRPHRPCCFPTPCMDFPPTPPAPPPSTHCLPTQPSSRLPTNSPTHPPFNPSFCCPLSCLLWFQFIYSSPCSPSPTSVQPVVHPPINLIHPSNQLPVSPSTNPSLHPPSHLPIHLPTYPSIHPPSSHLSFCLSARTLSHPVLNREEMTSDVGVQNIPLGQCGGHTGGMEAGGRPGGRRGDWGHGPGWRE